MKLDGQSISNAFKAHYDKIVALAAIAALLASIVLLGVKAVVARKQQARFDRFIEKLVPHYPEVPAVSRERFTGAMSALTKPTRLAASSKGAALVVPELRVSCEACRRPIEFATTNCIRCGHIDLADVGPDPLKDDSDGDGIPDGWETSHGMDKDNNSDGALDLDDDGWTSLEEYKASLTPGVDAHPKDAESFPTAWWANKLRVEKAESVKFDLIFKSAMKISANKYTFAVNHVGGRTYWAKIGDNVLGYTVKSYENKFKVVQDLSIGEKQVDVSELTLQLAGKSVVLVKGKQKNQFEKSASLTFIPDKQTVEVGDGDEFKIRGFKYLVKTIDAERTTVVINDPTLGQNVAIGRSGVME